MFVGLVWLTSNHMFGSDKFWDKSPSVILEIKKLASFYWWFLKTLKLPSFYSSNFKIFKNALGQFIQNFPSKHVIISTN